MNVLLQESLDNEWVRLNYESVQQQEAIQRRRWVEHRQKLSGKSINLRNLALIINTFPTKNAFNFCRHHIKKLYMNLVEGNSLTGIAGRPLYYLYEAPLATRETITPYSTLQANQCYINDSFNSNPGVSDKLLVCTTSRTHTLSMPLSVFHAYASKYFNAILYYFDTSRNHYRGMNESLNRNTKKIIKYLNPSSTAFVGTSAGACPAIGLYLSQNGSRVLAGSPIFDAHSDITDNLLNTEKQILEDSFTATFSDNAIDMKFKGIYDQLSHLAGAKNIYNMSEISSSHASLGTTLITRDFEKLLKWLSVGTQVIST